MLGQARCVKGLKLDPRRAQVLWALQGPGRLHEHFAWALCEEGLLVGARCHLLEGLRFGLVVTWGLLALFLDEV